LKATDNKKNDKLRTLPSIDRLLSNFDDALAEFGHEATVAALRQTLQQVRSKVIAGESPTMDTAAIRQAAMDSLRRDAIPGLRRVFNLTGTVLHTNLGRAVLPHAAIEAVRAAAGGFSSLEFDLDCGTRGDREIHVEKLLCELTGAEAATVVNNNAAAVLLTLNTLAMNGAVPVSRGELVEIGGSFRIPDVMERANCSLVEVGATNRTHLHDYRSAINEHTALLMKVHTSNYKIEGFTKDVSESELAELATEFGLPFVMDLGSGCLVDFSQHGLPREPTVASILAGGPDIVTFSGDKLLGGPQSGIIAGKADLVGRIKANPLKRALRLDKMTLAAMFEVLRLYRDPGKLKQTLPTLRFLTRPRDEIRDQARRVLPALNRALGERYHAEVVDAFSQTGSGSLPTSTIPSIAIAIGPANGGADIAKELSAAFRSLPVPVIGYAHKGRLLLDLRCLDNEDEFIAQLELLRV
jgi:L-seryl-tRNA(Ser) seleniumtransferase